MRDDIHKLGLPKEAVAYARGKGMSFLKKKPQNYIDMVAAVTNQRGKKKGFKNQDAGQSTTGGRQEALNRLVDDFLNG